MSITELYTLYIKSYLVDTDTRKIRKNAIFFALKGTNFNGNEFAAKALSLGASYVIVDEEKYVLNSKTILVNNALETLQKLANYHRNKLKATIIGLTGSNGKTTTKELINTVLKTRFTTTATVGNLNNHIGVPLTLLSMTPKTEIGIIEMGANHQKEIELLSAICEPDFGYITNFGKAHLEGFGGIEGVIKGKSELYTYLKNNNKTAIVNTEDAIQVKKTTGIKIIPFTKSIQFIAATPFVKIAYDNKSITSNLIGNYNYTNIAAAITIGDFLKIEFSTIKKAIEAYTPTNNRSQIITKEYNKIVLDAYNANPTSMTAALENLNSIDNNLKTVILGDMFELGPESALEHQKIVNIASAQNFNEIYFVGSLFFDTSTTYKKFKTYADFENHLKSYPIKNQTILIKGSRGMQLERVLALIS